jgi:ABC-type uncharacterized transport system permease subunit
MSSTIAYIAFSAYLLSAIMLMGRFVRPMAEQKLGNKPSKTNKKLAYLLAGFGIICHGIYLFDAIISQSGQNMSITNVLSLVSWLIAGSMLLSASVLPNVIMLPVVFGFAAITIFVAPLIPAEYIMHIEMQPPLVIHITLSLFAYGILVIAFLYALQMSFITHQLKRKGAAILHSSVPPLMLVEGILFKLILVGTTLLVVALLSGFVFLDNMFSREYAHKTVLSIAALFVYILLLTGQKLWGWRGKQVIILTIIGVSLLSLAYFGSRFVREVLL